MRLLLVEDEARLARALQRVLTADGFTVEWTGDGAQGLELARQGSFDAVLLDVMLPRLSGYDVVRTLRAEQNWVPVLMLSAKDGEHDQADGLDCGADDYLTKPFPTSYCWPGYGRCYVVVGHRAQRCWPPASCGWTRPAATSTSATT